MVVGIVSSGIGTTASMLNMFRHIGADAELVVDPAGLAKYSHLVLPGVGHYSEGSSKLAEGGWREPIIDFAKTGKPLLGVDRKITRLNSSHVRISYAVFCLKKKK